MSASRASKLVAVGSVLLLLALAHYFGVLGQFAEPARAAQSLRDRGALGAVGFVLAYTVLQPFGIPGSVFVFAAPLIWPWPEAYALSMIGTMGASVVGFSFARFVARDWIARRIPDRFRKYDEALAARAFATVFLLRFVFWMPQLLHAFLGLSKVRFWTHFWASLAGYAIPLLLVSYFGQRLFEALRHASLGTWLGIAGGIAALTLAVWALRRPSRRG